MKINEADFSKIDVGKLAGVKPDKVIDTGLVGGQKFSQAEMAYLIKLAEELERRREFGGIRKWFDPEGPYPIESCPKHKAFFDAGSTHKQRVFLAGNRVGKSVTGAYELACHLTGIYPDWWEGKRFDKAVNCWAGGKTGQTTRDTVQKELLGSVGQPGGGMIPKDCIINTWARQGVAGAVDTAEILHVSGKSSFLGFKSFDQDVQAFFGTAKDVVWLDEECPEIVYNECLTRTMTTKGIIYITFTPLLGITPLIASLIQKADFLGGSLKWLAEATPSGE